jgi:hypothetical protein
MTKLAAWRHYAFLDELEKIGKSRSLARDFLGGVDPTGGATFRYGMEDVEQGLAAPGLRKALGTVGGVVGGAAVVPSAISGLIGGVKGFSAGGGLRGRLVGAGRGFVSGLAKPFSKVYQSARASGGLKALERGGEMSLGQAKNLRALASDMPAIGGFVKKLSPEQVQQYARHLPAAQVANMRKGVGGQLSAGLATLGTSGLIGGGSAYLQYGKGRAAAQKYQQQLAAPQRGAGHGR